MSDVLVQFWKELNSLFTSVGYLPKTTQSVIAFSFLIIGALFCFVGYYFFKYLLGLAGFLTAGVVGLAASRHYLPDWPEIGQFSLAALAGAVGAVVFYFLFFCLGFLIFGAVATMWFALLLLPREWGIYRTLITLGSGFTGGLAALMLRRQLLIIATSVIGATAIMSGVGHFVNWPLSPAGLMQPDSLNGALIASIGRLDWTQQLIIYGLTAVFAVTGLIVQGQLPEKKEEN